ncbi:MAG: hypothetical protein JO313_10295 [Verrucomicrobia bacterium]|nr:hypothetical protein [Verrucomicrobiota bacterium]
MENSAPLDYSMVKNKAANGKKHRNTKANLLTPSEKLNREIGIFIE